MTETASVWVSGVSPEGRKEEMFLRIRGEKNCAHVVVGVVEIVSRRVSWCKQE